MQSNYDENVYEKDATKDVAYAGFWARLAAYLIDSVIVWAGLLVVRLVMFFVSSGMEGTILGGNLLFHYSLTDIVVYLAEVVYFILFTYHTGGTLGKRALNLRVVSADGGKLSLWDVVYRETIGRFLCAVTIGIGYLFVAADKEKRGLHDMLCDTRVIYAKTMKIYPVYYTTAGKKAPNGGMPFGSGTYGNAGQNRGGAPYGNTMPGQGNVPYGNATPGQGSAPYGNAIPGQGNMTYGSGMPGRGNASYGNAMPGQGSAPYGNAVPNRGTMTYHSTLSGQKNKFYGDVAPNAGNMPNMGNVPNIGGAPNTWSTPNVENAPNVGNAPDVGKTPDVGYVPREVKYEESQKTEQSSQPDQEGQGVYEYLKKSEDKDYGGKETN